MRNENEEININDHIINTIYVTNRKDNKPQLIFDSKNGIDVNVHIQLIGLNYGIHSLKLAILKNNVNSLKNSTLVDFSDSIDTRNFFKEQNADKKELYIGDFSYYVVATAEELANSSILKIFVIIDDKYAKDILIFLRNKNGKSKQKSI